MQGDVADFMTLSPGDKHVVMRREAAGGWRGGAAGNLETLTSAS